MNYSSLMKFVAHFAFSCKDRNMATLITHDRASLPLTHGKGVVLFDGECPLCLKSVHILRRLDWFNRLDFQNARDWDQIPVNDANLVQERLIEEMHVLRPDRQKAYAGFRAFRWIAGRLPLLWCLYPLLFLPGIPTIGQRIYLWIAKNRFHLVPCHNGICTIPSKRK